MRIQVNETSKGQERGEIDLMNKSDAKHRNMNNLKISIFVKFFLLLFALLAIVCLSIESNGMIPNNPERNLNQTSSLMSK